MWIRRILRGKIVDLKDPHGIRRILWGKTVDPKDPGDPEGKLCGSEGSSGSQGSGGEIMWIRRNPWEKTVDPNDPPRIRGIPKENYVDSKDPVRGWGEDNVDLKDPLFAPMDPSDPSFFFGPRNPLDPTFFSHGILRIQHFTPRDPWDPARILMIHYFFPLDS